MNKKELKQKAHIVWANTPSATYGMFDLIDAIIDALPEEPKPPTNEEVLAAFQRTAEILGIGPEPKDERTTQPASAQVLVPREIWIHKTFGMWTEVGGPYDADYEAGGWRKTLAWPLIEPPATVILGQRSDPPATSPAQPPKPEPETLWEGEVHVRGNQVHEVSNDTVSQCLSKDPAWRKIKVREVRE